MSEAEKPFLEDIARYKAIMDKAIAGEEDIRNYSDYENFKFYAIGYMHRAFQDMRLNSKESQERLGDIVSEWLLK